MDLEERILQLEADNALLNARCKQYAEAYEYMQEQVCRS